MSKRIQDALVYCVVAAVVAAGFWVGWRFSAYRKLNVTEARIIALEARMSLVESNAYQTLVAAQSVKADLGALRKAILAAMTTNMTARPLPPGTPRVVTP